MVEVINDELLAVAKIIGQVTSRTEFAYAYFQTRLHDYLENLTLICVFFCIKIIWGSSTGYLCDQNITRRVKMFISL